MTTDRRKFVKMMALGAAGYAVGLHLNALNFDACQGADLTCILLHGLFFMTFKGNTLIVATPDFFKHQFGERDQGATTTVGPLPKGAPDIDWTQSEYKLQDNQSSTNTFPSSIMQFSASDTGTGELMPAGSTGYKFQLKLPRPCDIFPFRPSNLAVFAKCAKDVPQKPQGKKSVKQSVIDSCGGLTRNGPIALVTGLVYQRLPGCPLPHVLSFYAEHHLHCSNINANAVNPALKAAQALFAPSSGNNFDLQFDPTVPVQSVCRPTPNPYGVVERDEYSLCELQPTFHGCIQDKGPNPINCAQFGVNG